MSERSPAASRPERSGPWTHGHDQEPQWFCAKCGMVFPERLRDEHEATECFTRPASAASRDEYDLQAKQEASPGQAASAAPGVTDAEATSAGATGQARPGLAAERNAGAPAPSAATVLSLDDYEIANLREGLLFLRAVGGDTGDWLGQLLMKLPEVERAPNVSLQEQRRALALRVGWQVLHDLPGFRP